MELVVVLSLEQLRLLSTLDDISLSLALHSAWMVELMVRTWLIMALLGVQFRMSVEPKFDPRLAMNKKPGTLVDGFCELCKCGECGEDLG